MPALLSHLASPINGRMSQVSVPGTPTYLDAILGNQDLIAGFKPRIGGRHIRVVALAAFPPWRIELELATLDKRHDAGGGRDYFGQRYEIKRRVDTEIRGMVTGPKTAYCALVNNRGGTESNIVECEPIC